MFKFKYANSGKLVHVPLKLYLFLVITCILAIYSISYIENAGQLKILGEFESLFNNAEMRGNCTYVLSNEYTMQLRNKTHLSCQSYAGIDAGSCVSLKNKNIKCFPLFMIIGAMKSGTGELMKWLNMHPMLISGKGKGNSNEIHYFGSDEYDKSICKSMDYIKHFPDFDHFTNNRKFTFDKSPDYMRSLESLSQIKQMIPNIKLIVILRHPIDRAISGFQHNCRHRRYIKTNRNLKLRQESNYMAREFIPKGSILNIKTFFYNNTGLDDLKRYIDFHDYTILSYPCRAKDFLSYYLTNNDLGLNEISVGFYDLQLQNIFNLFSNNNVLILFQENMWTDTFHALQNVENFLNIPCYNYKSEAIFSEMNLPPRRKDSIINYLPLATFSKGQTQKSNHKFNIPNREKLLLLRIYYPHIANFFSIIKRYYNRNIDIPKTWTVDF